MWQLPFKRVFLANRGEISRRIASTAQLLGIETVCVTDSQQPPLYLQELITQFAHVDEESPSLYLDPDAMVGLALEYGCDCLHPGFGFLSENAAFAEKVTAAGLTWLGPPPQAMAAMADKATARDTAERLQVPCTRGMRIADPMADTQSSGSAIATSLATFSSQAPFPLLIKAALGGGGKGMRLIHQASELSDAVQKASSEALNAFGDSSLVIEQYIAQSRHIEVQILADKHGQTFAIGDRDCSLQRRHQKIIEEAPAPGLSPATRSALHAAAVRLASAVGYESAGTVEFLLDCSEGARNRDPQPFYFLEMNTRLQVEHPVTEEVYGLDLVAWQFAIAAGERLPASYATLAPRGHSLEARLYGEDIHKNFFPAPGKVAAFLPHHGQGIRWEVGLDTVDIISSRFDPMIAKIVVHAEDRRQALRRLTQALAKTMLVAPATNKELLMMLASQSAFTTTACNTHFIGDHLPALCAGIAAERQRYADEAAACLAWLEGAYNDGSLQTPRLGHQGKALGIDALTRLAFQPQAASVPRHDQQEGGKAAHQPAGEAATAKPRKTAGFSLSLLTHHHSPGAIARVLLSGKALQQVNGKLRNFSFIVSKEERQTIFAVLRKGYEYTVIKEKRGWQGEGASAAKDGDLNAPVPGKVIKIRVRVNDVVAKDDSLFVLESMKMEFDVRSTAAGKIAKINVREGQQVTSGEVLAIIETQSSKQ